MLLGVKERFLLWNAIQPQIGNWSKLRIVEKLRTDLHFTEAEHDEFGLYDDSEIGRFHWKTDEEVEIEIGAVAYRVVIDSLKALARADELREDYLTLSAKFPEAEKECLEEEAKNQVAEKERAKEAAQRIIDAVPTKDGSDVPSSI